jgi:hypothetical protein
MKEQRLAVPSTEISLDRRRVLMVGAGLAAGLASLRHPGAALAEQEASGLPVKRIEEILQTEGHVSDGVLSLGLNRDDLTVTGAGIPFKPAWQLNHEFAMQSIGKGKAILTGELTLLGREANPVIDQLVKQGLKFQALHQHFLDLSPQVFHIHFRGIGEPVALAHAVAAVVGATGTPLPQKSKPDAKTSLDKDRLEKILGGSAEIEDDGVVVVSVARKDTIVLDGVRLKPDMGVSHTVAFQPLDDGRTAVAPDFALIASEVNGVMRVMRAQGFDVHCLYNQETAETPQLYFSHQLAVGDAYKLAQAVRKGIEATNAKFKAKG